MSFLFTSQNRKLLLLALSLLWLLTSLENSAPNAQAQSGDIFVFDDVIDNSIEANAVALGDLDNDGDLDAYLGLKDSTHNKIYFNNEGSFTNPIDAGLQTSTKAVALGDMDNDGYIDAVVGTGPGEFSMVEYNDGTGQLVFPLTLSSNQADTNAVEVGDIDQDGDLDIFMATEQSSYLYINQGGVQGGTTGVFVTGQTLGTTGGPDLAVGDLDNDGDLDVATIINSGQAIQLWFNTGGVFQAVTTLPFEPGTFVSDLAIGLINNDNLPDMYIVTPNGPDLVAINNGSNSFNPGQSVPTSNSQDVVLSDVDSDGDLDAVVAVWEYGVSGDQVWLNDSGIFSQAQIFTDSRSVALAVGDMNGDTTPDVLFARLEGPKTLWLNQLLGLNSNGYFEYGQEITTDTASGIELGDLDGNGTLDAVLTIGEIRSGYLGITFPQRLEIWFNQGDAEFSLSEILTEVTSSNSFVTVDVALGDVNNDDDLDIVMIDSTGTAKLWLNNGGIEGGTEGSFTDSGQVLPGAERDTRLALADINLDGYADIIVLNKGSRRDDILPTIRLWLNQGDGTFNPAGQTITVPSIYSSRQLLVDDLDGDNDPDIIAGNNLHIWLNQGGNQNGTPGVFQPQGLLLPNSELFPDATLYDGDGDGDLDVYIIIGEVVFSNEEPVGTIESWSNDGSANFTLKNRTEIDRYPITAWASTWGDWDDDGDVDLFMGVLHPYVEDNPLERQPPGIQIWRNEGDDNFVLNGQCLYIPTGENIRESIAVAAGDVNGDNKLELLNGNLDGTHVWFNGADVRHSRCCSLELAFQLPVPDNDNRGSLTLQAVNQTLTNIGTFFDLRDTILAATPGGQYFIDLYYANDAEIGALLVSDATLLRDGVAALSAWQPNLQALVDSEGNSTTITAGQIQAMQAFLTRLSQVGSPTLQQVIAAELARLGPLNDYVGMTMDEATASVLGAAPSSTGIYLPVVIK